MKKAANCAGTVDLPAFRCPDCLGKALMMNVHCVISYFTFQRYKNLPKMLAGNA